MKHWHTMKLEEIYETLKTKKEGLSSAEANQRLEQNGKNELASKPRTTVFEMLLEQLKDKMIIILFIASLISFLLGETLEGGVILVIIAINAIVSIVQEKKAADAIESLKKMNTPHAQVLRDQKKVSISSKELVVGDIVYIEDGSIVPADIRLIESNHLKIDESSLTGESVPVEKEETLILPEETVLAERKNMVYSSTIVTYGTAMGVVVATGMHTEIGSIAKMLDGEDELETPLKKKLNAVGQTLSIVGILISILIFIIGLCYGKPVVSLLMIAISLAISVIPEGLPATATIVMALGVQRMTKKNALVKKLPAVETLGSASVICSDKTGTLTQNKMTVIKAAFYDDFMKERAEDVETVSFDKDLLYAGILCNNAYVDIENPNNVIGDPTESCLLVLAQTQQLNPVTVSGKHPKLFEQPFDSIRKRMSTVHQIEEGYTVYTKGATEELLPFCTHIKYQNEIIPLTDEVRSHILNTVETMSKQSLRVLGFAKKSIQEVPKSDDVNLEEDLIFLGVTGMIDPPRKEVIGAIQTCHKAGIKVIMITGDNKITATAIAQELGIYQEGNDVITGDELAKLSPEELCCRVKNTTVFARVTPQDKLHIVKALQKNGEVVAMTGDGVNDSPALKIADIGVAMGITGTDVAKGAADMVLLDDNFTTIEAAIREGRRVYRNIQKVIQFLLAGNIAEVMTIFVAMLLNWETPILAVHILLINLVTDTLPALALGVDPASSNIMNHKPVKSGSLFERGLVGRIVFYGLLIATLSLVAFRVGLHTDYQTGVTMAFLVLSLSQIVHALNQHSNTISVFSKKHPKNIYLYGAMLLSMLIVGAIIFIPFFKEFFFITNLSMENWIFVLIASIAPLVIVEIVKFWRRLVSKN